MFPGVLCYSGMKVLNLKNFVNPKIWPVLSFSRYYKLLFFYYKISLNQSVIKCCQLIIKLIFFQNVQKLPSNLTVDTTFKYWCFDIKNMIKNKQHPVCHISFKKSLFFLNMSIYQGKNLHVSLKVMSNIFLQLCFLSLKKRTFETMKNVCFFFSLQKLVSFLKYSNFRILQY